MPGRGVDGQGKVGDRHAPTIGDRYGQFLSLGRVQFHRGFKLIDELIAEPLRLLYLDVWEETSSPKQNADSAVNGEGEDTVSTYHFCCLRGVGGMFQRMSPGVVGHADAHSSRVDRRCPC